MPFPNRAPSSPYPLAKRSLDILKRWLLFLPSSPESTLVIIRFHQRKRHVVSGKLLPLPLQGVRGGNLPAGFGLRALLWCLVGDHVRRPEAVLGELLEEVGRALLGGDTSD